ncbi:MAG: VOC family protein [Chloroflexi bacterium]|nr:VOC family protein [Chloroflexota bacterium]
MPLLGLAHTGLTVRDLHASIAFYTTVLGLRVTSTYERQGPAIAQITGFPGAHLRIARLRFPDDTGHELELVEYVAPRGTATDMRTCNPGNGHIAFFVDDIEAVYRHLIAHGVACRSQPATFSHAPAGGRALYFSDPDGITLELVQRPAAP